MSPATRAFAITAGVAFTCACGRSSSNPYATATIPSSPPTYDPPSTPPVATDAGASAADAGSVDNGPPFGVVQKPSTIVPIADRGRDPWPKKALPVGKRLGRGGVVPPGIPGPDRVAIATTDKKGLFVDARTGNVLATLPAEPEYVSPKAGAIVLEGAPPRLLRVYDAKVIAPQIEAKEKTKSAFLAATPRQDRVVGLAETASGAKLAGIASDDFTKVVLTDTPFGSATTRLSATLNAREWQISAVLGRDFGEPGGTPFFLRHDDTCLRARVEKDGRFTCIEYGPKPGLGDGAQWLDDGYVSWGSSIGNPAWGDRLVTIRARDERIACVRRGSRATPPRVVVTCHGPGREAFLWGPGPAGAPSQLLQFQGPLDPNDVGGLVGADVGFGLPMPDAVRAQGGEQARPTSRWLDLVGMRVLTSPPMLPLTIAAFAGMEPIGLASSTENKVTSVWTVDFDAAARELVTTVNDCQGKLGELREDRAHGRKRWLILACMTPPPKDGVAQNLIWSEILDTETKTRWRTALMPELFFPDGVVVLSTRRAMAAESKTAPGELTSVDLAAL